MPGIGSETHQIGGSSFKFSGARLEKLGATEYTLASVVVDITGSTYMFADELRQMVEAAVGACKRSPRAENLLVRVTEFNNSIGVREVHGFEMLSGIDPATRYTTPQPHGMTNLYDATFEAVGATLEYAEHLMDADYLANGIVIVITDGDDNDSKMTTASIRDKILAARTGEKIESLLVFVIGINAGRYSYQLDEFRTKAELDGYIDAGDATKATLAKLAQFVSHSVSSQSQALGTGGPSQTISATI